MLNNFNPSELLQQIFADPNLSPQEKDRAKQIVSAPDFLTKLASGALGASLAYLISKYLKLGKTAQILLTIAGYGIGKLLLDAHNKSSSNKPGFQSFNHSTKSYEIDPSKR